MEGERTCHASPCVGSHRAHPPKVCVLVVVIIIVVVVVVVVVVVGQRGGGGGGGVFVAGTFVPPGFPLGMRSGG